MSDNHELLKECKKLIEEIRAKIDAIEKLPPEVVIKRIKSLPIEDKIALLRTIKLGEIALKRNEVIKKHPHYRC